MRVANNRERYLLLRNHSSTNTMNDLIKQKPNTPAGGSASLKPKRNTKKTDRKENADAAIKRELGETVYQEMKAQWILLNESKLPNDKHIADGMIVTLISQGFSQIKIRAVLDGLGGHRMQRVTDEYLLPSDDRVSTRKPPSHAFTSEDITRIKSCYDTWELEDGFPCAHRKPRQFFVDASHTWTSLHASYCQRMDEG